MLNFLLEKDKKNIVTEYFFRVAIYFLLFGLFSLVILVSLFLPSNFYSKYKNINVSQQLSSIKEGVGKNSEDPIKTITGVNKFIKVFSDDGRGMLFSDIINKIISLKNKKIKISLFSINKSKDGSLDIIIKGISDTRDDLTSFDKELKKDGYFQSVELPVSDLIKNIDSDFTITLTYKK